MNLELTNIGKIEHANIEINGITVIAGENNTGKSTIGKMLFCVFHSFYKIEEQVKEERVRTITRVLSNFYHESANRFTRNFDLKEFAEEIVNQKDLFLDDSNLFIEKIQSFYLSKDAHFQQYLQQEALEALAKKIDTFLKLEDNEIIKVILQQRLEAEFAMNIGHLNSTNRKSTVKLSIKQNNIDFEIIDNKDIIINDYMNLNKAIMYIDDPFVLDDLSRRHLILLTDLYSHRQDLLQKIANLNNVTDFTLVDKIVVNKKLEKILDIMNEVCDGKISADEGNHFVYESEKLNGKLEMINLSTGMKSFVILRQLLQNGNIDENGIIILDEPEIHLHPEWQLKFAESIVLIQKEFGVNILLNTHSPYFLNAIEVYSAKYDLKNKYYLISEKNDSAHVKDVTDNLEEIYEKLAKPLHILENLEYRNADKI